jgi:multiple antibiotic resistance protein
VIEAAVLAFTTFFATVAPFDVAAIYAVMTARAGTAKRHRMATKAVLIASGILLAFALLGNDVLRLLGVGLPALRISGGILLLLIAIDMVFARHSGVTSTTEAESEEAEASADISVFPLATPLIAGPGAMGATVLRMAEAQGQLAHQMVVIAALLLVMAITWGLLIAAVRVSRFLGITGINVIMRVLGVLLAALAVQYIVDGIVGTGLAGTGSAG